MQYIQDKIHFHNQYIQDTKHFYSDYIQDIRQFIYTTYRIHYIFMHNTSRIKYIFIQDTIHPGYRIHYTYYIISIQYTQLRIWYSLSAHHRHRIQNTIIFYNHIYRIQKTINLLYPHIQDIEINLPSIHHIYRVNDTLNLSKLHSPEKSVNGMETVWSVNNCVDKQIIFSADELSKKRLMKEAMKMAKHKGLYF